MHDFAYKIKIPATQLNSMSHLTSHENSIIYLMDEVMRFKASEFSVAQLVS